jgi:DNA-binding transcriptional ArsR family regulator
MWPMMVIIVPSPGTGDGKWGRWHMKGQDILLLFKLISLWHQDFEGVGKSVASGQACGEVARARAGKIMPNAGKSAEDMALLRYSVRELSAATGVSKSQVSLSLHRCYESGLARLDRLTKKPSVNRRALCDFVIYGLRYVFPVKPAQVTRGVATAWAAPVLAGKLMHVGELMPVWSDAMGDTRGQAVEPLYPTVSMAVRRDHMLYALLALTDAIRIGQVRERTLACDLLAKMLKGGEDE